MSVRTGAKARAWAKQQADTGTTGWLGMCQRFTRMCFGVGGGFPSAIKAWEGAKRRHLETDPTKIPTGVPVYWRGPGKHGHAAFSDGDGYCYSTDIKRRSQVDRVPISLIAKAWPGAVLLGWTEDVNGVVIYEPTVEKAREDRKTKPAMTRTLRAQRLMRQAHALLLAEGTVGGGYTAAKRDKLWDAINTKATPGKAARP